MRGASPYLGAVVRAEHAGPAARRSLRFALLEQPGLGALSSVRRGNIRSRSEVRKFASEGTKHEGRNNHQTTTLGLVRPIAHGAPRASFPPPPTFVCCGMYLQGGNGVDVHGDSSALHPAHCRDQHTRVTVLKWHGYRARCGASFMPNQPLTGAAH